MSQRGMSRITGLSSDDLFLTFDADEIPKKEAILFLKMHEGYNQLIRDRNEQDSKPDRCKAKYMSSFNTTVRQ